MKLNDRVSFLFLFLANDGRNSDLRIDRQGEGIACFIGMPTISLLSCQCMILILCSLVLYVSPFCSLLTKYAERGPTAIRLLCRFISVYIENCIISL